MSRYDRLPAGTYIAAVAGFLCILSAAPSSLRAQPMMLPTDIQPMEDPSIIFSERFSSNHRAEPVFTRPEIQSLLSSLPPWSVIGESTALTDTAVAKTYPSHQIPFAELKGPAKVLEGLTTTPGELLAAEAEAEQGAPPSQAQESAPAPGTAIATPAEPSPEAAGPQETASAAGQTPRPVDDHGKGPEREVAEQEQGARPSEPQARPRFAGSRRIGAGRATWYQHPGRTASGEWYDPDQLTAAHHTLPLGTWLRVVNEQTGRSINLRINDRIPRSTRRIIIDLSRGSARILGIAGIAQVSLYQEPEQDVQVIAEGQPAETFSFIAALGMALSRSAESSRLDSALWSALRQRAAAEVASARMPERSQQIEVALRNLLRQKAAQL